MEIYMAIFDIPMLVSKLRLRTELTREMMKFCEQQMDKLTQYRAETGKGCPLPKNFEFYMKDIDLALEGFVFPSLELHKTQVLQDHITQALNIKNTDLAQNLFDELELLHDYNDELSHQFYLCKKARLWSLLGKHPNQIYPLIEDGIKITFNNFDETELHGKTLVLEESELIHTLACTKASDGKLDEAIEILICMKNNLEILPTSDKEKERQITPVLLSLSQYQLQRKDYNEALETCHLGVKFSASYMQGGLNPKFEHNRVLALHRQGMKWKCHPHLHHAYAGYVLLGDMEDAKNLLVKAEDKFEIKLSLYGIDEIEWESVTKNIYNRGKQVEANHPSEMVLNLRKSSGLSGKTLSYGICSSGTLSKIEKAKADEQSFEYYDYYYFESLMQRLGRDVKLYHNFFLSKRDFDGLQLKNRISLLLSQKKYKEAMELLVELKTMQHFFYPSSNKEYYMNKQFVLMAEACIFADTNGKKHADLPKMLFDAINITCPNFDERDIDRHPTAYTHNELFLINQLAIHYGAIGNSYHAVDIYAQLHRHFNDKYKNGDDKYADELEKARMYSSILSNYSTHLGRTNQREKALTIVDEAETFERSRGRLTNLPTLICNKGYNQMKLGADSKDVIPLFVLAYYGDSMFADFGSLNDMLITRKFMKETFGISLD